MMLVDAGKLLPMISWRNTFRPFADATVALEKVKTRGELSFKLVPATRQSTIRDLLPQTSGIAGGYVSGWVAKIYAEGHLNDGQFNNADLAERLGKVPLTTGVMAFRRRAA